MILFAAGLDVDPWDLWRVFDPDFATADARSATGALVIGEPLGVPRRRESVPEVDAGPAVEAVEVMGIGPWHALGATGEGVKVAVFDLQWFGTGVDGATLGPYTSHDCYTQRSCDLPMAFLNPRFAFEEGRHGLGCAEVIRSVAPGVELHLVRVNSETTLENAVDWAIREGIDIASVSLSFFNTSFYDGTGPITKHAERFAAAGGLMVVSSGNYADQHWAGMFVDGDGDGALDTDDGGPWVYLDEDQRGTVYVTWDQFGACGRTDLDVVVYDEDDDIVARSEERQPGDEGSCTPVERVSIPGAAEGWRRLAIQHVRGPTSGLRLNVLATSGTVFRPHPNGSMADPASSSGVLTVGAVRADGYLTNGPEVFSSRGPTSDGRQKPEVAGPDGVSTLAYGARGFFGTSASAPAVAGAIAVVMSSEPGLDAQGAAERIKGWGIAETASAWGLDPDFGYGRVHLPHPDAAEGGCGHGRMWMGALFFVPLAWRRRRPTAR